MPTSPTAATQPKAVVELAESELLGHGSATFCPNPKMPLWNHHPKVFIDVGTTGEGRCPYCGTVYRRQGGAHPGH
jgi:uncharacterized Zn-finger protein